jgi:general secretion pathway protein G
MRVRNSPHLRPRAGFTLMEMMVVVAIIVVIAGMGVVILGPQIDEGNKTKAQTTVKSLSDACTMYKAQHGGIWPASLETLTVRDEGGFGPYVKMEDLTDPWGQRYQYDQSGGRNQGLQPDIFTTNQNYGTFGNWSTRWQK